MIWGYPKFLEHPNAEKLPGFWVSFVPPPALLVVWEDLGGLGVRGPRGFAERFLFENTNFFLGGGGQKWRKSQSQEVEKVKV